MKRIALLLFVLLAGCAPTTNADQPKRFEQGHYESHGRSEIEIFTDSNTGCKYIVYTYLLGNAGAGGITPLLNSDGEPDCQ